MKLKDVKAEVSRARTRCRRNFTTIKVAAHERLVPDRDLLARYRVMDHLGHVITACSLIDRNKLRRDGELRELIRDTISLLEDTL